MKACGKDCPVNGMLFILYIKQCFIQFIFEEMHKMRHVNFEEMHKFRIINLEETHTLQYNECTQANMLA